MIMHDPTSYSISYFPYPGRPQVDIPLMESLQGPSLIQEGPQVDFHLREYLPGPSPIHEGPFQELPLSRKAPPGPSTAYSNAIVNLYCIL